MRRRERSQCESQESRRGGERWPAGEDARCSLASGEVANQTLEPARLPPTAAPVAITTCRLLLLIAAPACACAAIRRVAHTCAALPLLLVGCAHVTARALWATAGCLCRR